jgi:hypothetical protein
MIEAREAAGEAEPRWKVSSMAKWTVVDGRMACTARAIFSQKKQLELAAKNPHPGGAGAHGNRLGDVALAGAGGTGEEDVLVGADEVELGELEDDARLRR